MTTIFGELELKATYEKQIDAIRIITGYSANTIRPLFYKDGVNVKKEADCPAAYRADFDFVVSLLTELGRDDLAKKVRKKRD